MQSRESIEQTVQTDQQEGRERKKEREDNLSKIIYTFLWPYKTLQHGNITIILGCNSKLINSHTERNIHNISMQI